MCVPVVGTFHAGIPEAVIHGETGLLGPEGDVCVTREESSTALAEPGLAIGI